MYNVCICMYVCIYVCKYVFMYVCMKRKFYIHKKYENGAAKKIIGHSKLKL